MPRELGINVDNMHIALRRVSDDGFVVLACCRVGFDVDAECAIEFELQSTDVLVRAHSIYCALLFES